MILILFDFIINEAVQTDNKCCVIIVQMTEYRRIITGPAQWIPSSFRTSVLRCKRDTKQLCSTAVLMYQSDPVEITDRFSSTGSQQSVTPVPRCKRDAGKI